MAKPCGLPLSQISIEDHTNVLEQIYVRKLKNGKAKSPYCGVLTSHVLNHYIGSSDQHTSPICEP